jgi:hypothetical protein
MSPVVNTHGPGPPGRTRPPPSEAPTVTPEQKPPEPPADQVTRTNADTVEE